MLGTIAPTILVNVLSQTLQQYVLTRTMPDYGKACTIGATLRMKRYLLCLLPWMVTLAAASEATRPAEVVYTHVGATIGDVFRVEDECFIDPALTAPWGWS